jgi:hypothetical protein
VGKLGVVEALEDVLLFKQSGVARDIGIGHGLILART